MPAASHILMIRPVNFSFNEQTAVNNAFQVNDPSRDIQQKSRKEFDDLVLLLRKHKIGVTVLEDTEEPYTPDSIFPNNWFSSHENGTVVLYPMFAENRRLERKPHIIEKLKEEFVVKEIKDYSYFEKDESFLEGTGSMVLDRENKIAYACLSARTDKKVFQKVCNDAGYAPVSFHAVDNNGTEIYHTNVMMCVAHSFCVICMDCIHSREEQSALIHYFKQTHKEIVTITMDQMAHFAGNMLQVQNEEGQLYLVMSTQAYQSLTADQIEKISLYSEILHSDLFTIEKAGGGSARCMMAEIYLPQK